MFTSGLADEAPRVTVVDNEPITPGPVFVLISGDPVVGVVTDTMELMGSVLPS